MTIPPAPPPLNSGPQKKNCNHRKITFATEQSEEIKNIVDSQSDWFESQVLACALTSTDFFAAVLPVLCVNGKDGSFAGDFTSGVDNVLYRSLCVYQLCVGGSSPARLEADFARAILRHLASECKPDTPFISEDEIEQAIERLNQLLQFSAEAIDLVCAGINYWLRKQRIALTIRAQSGYTNWDPSEFIDDLRLQMAALDARAGDDHSHPFGTGLEEAPDEVERVSTGLRGLDEALGGGLVRGDYTVAIASSGVGKSVLACQLCSHLAFQGLRGLLITTEEPRRAIESRIISNEANIAFHRIRDSFDQKKLQPRELAEVGRIRASLEKNLLIAEWLSDRSRSITQDLETEVSRVEHLDFLVFDWIGGAIGSSAPDQIRHAYQAASDKLADIALRLNVICLAMAQAHPLQSRNKPKVDSTMLSECKTLGRKATNIIGMSGLLVPTDDENPYAEAVYQNRQYFYVSKARKSKGGVKPFIRDFDYQRIKDVTGT